MIWLIVGLYLSVSLGVATIASNSEDDIVWAGGVFLFWPLMALAGTFYLTMITAIKGPGYLAYYIRKGIRCIF